jgi:hypothetical protein
MKLDIIYRCCNSEVDSPIRDIRPNWFDKIKCLNSFLNSVKKNSYYINKVIFLHDGETGRLYDSIPDQYEKIRINYKSNELSLVETFKIADTLKNNIYFVEDDYLHLPNSIGVIAQGVEKFKLVTGYDHLDRYKRTDDLTYGKEYIAFSNKTNCHWRTAESTCCTWATTNEAWKSVVGDFAKTYRLNDRELFRGLYTQHNMRLWNPIPAVTTQVDQFLSPSIDWEQFQTQAANISLAS